MVTAYPGRNPEGTQVQVQIPHQQEQQAFRADPVESTEALHDIHGLTEEEERLHLVNRGQKKILFHKLRMLDNKLRDVVAMRAAENSEALSGVEDQSMAKAQEAINSAQDLLAATHVEKQFRWRWMSIIPNINDSADGDAA